MTMFTRRSILKAIGASSLLSSQGLLASKAFAGERDDQLNILPEFSTLDQRKRLA